MDIPTTKNKSFLPIIETGPNSLYRAVVVHLEYNAVEPAGMYPGLFPDSAASMEKLDV